MLEKFSCILIRYKYPLMGMTLVLAVVFPFLFKWGRCPLAMRLSLESVHIQRLSSAQKWGCHPR